MRLVGSFGGPRAPPALFCALGRGIWTKPGVERTRGQVQTELLECDRQRQAKATTQAVKLALDDCRNQITRRLQQWQVQKEARQLRQDAEAAIRKKLEEARSVQEQVLQRLQAKLGEERAKADHSAAEAQVLRRECAALREAQLSAERAAAEAQALWRKCAAQLRREAQLSAEREKALAQRQASAQQQALEQVQRQLQEESTKAERERAESQREARAERGRQEERARAERGRQEERARAERGRQEERAMAERVEDVIVPEFRPDSPTLWTHLEYTHHNRRCRKASVFIGLISAVAKEGFTAGQPQFTVRVIEPKVLLMIGVATADAPRIGDATYQHGVFLYHGNGHVYSVDNLKQPYTAENCFLAGCRVTMRLDFAKGTAAYEVDGRALGVVPCPLPKGPLYPAVLFHNAGQEVEFVPSTS
eukprot:EG_transcript_3252